MVEIIVIIIIIDTIYSNIVIHRVYPIKQTERNKSKVK